MLSLSVKMWNTALLQVDVNISIFCILISQSIEVSVHDRWHPKFQICFSKIVLVLHMLPLEKAEEELTCHRELCVLLLQLVESCLVWGNAFHNYVGVMLEKSTSDGVLHYHKSNIQLSFELYRLCEMIWQQRCCVLLVERLGLVAPKWHCCYFLLTSSASIHDFKLSGSPARLRRQNWRWPSVFLIKGFSIAHFLSGGRTTFCTSSPEQKSMIIVPRSEFYIACTSFLCFHHSLWKFLLSSSAHNFSRLFFSAK